MKLSERLTRWREGNEWSVEVAAVRLGISGSTLRNYENGDEPKNRGTRARVLRILSAWERVNATD